MGKLEDWDDVLRVAEDVVREGGLDLPVAWAISFIVDNWDEIEEGLKAKGHRQLARRLNELAYELESGLDAAIEDDDDEDEEDSGDDVESDE